MIEAAKGPPTIEAILEAARRRYARFGPHKTTMGEVARDAGCSRTTLYSHFPSKSELYARLLERETSAFRAELEALVSAPRPALDRLRAILEATLRIYSGTPVLRGALTGDEEMALERVARPVIEAHEQRVLELLRRVLEEGIAEGALRPLDAGAVAYLMYHLGRTLVTREVSGRADHPFEHILTVMDDVIGHGILATSTRSRRRRS